MIGPDQLAREISELQSRCLDLERRFRAFAASSVKVFPDLEDVPSWTEISDFVEDPADVSVGPGTARVAWGVVENDSGDLVWAPVRLASGGGVTTHTGKCHGDETTGSGTEDWVLSTGASSMGVASSPGYGDGFTVYTAGIYLVDTTVYATDGSAVDIVTWSPNSPWQWGHESGQCRANPAIYESVGAGEDGAGMSQTFALYDGATVLTMITAGTGEWQMSVTLLAEADIIEGDCET